MVVNIFFLSANPAEAAEMSCDRHSIKMILESAQMLSTNLRLHGYDGEEYIYGSTHAKHPSTIWATRYGKFHKSEEILYRCGDLKHWIPTGSLTVPPKCMGLEYKMGESTWDDVVASYRNYYQKGKTYMNKGKGPQWNKIPAKQPSWFSFLSM